MDALTCIETRRTAPVLVGPEPTSVELDRMLKAATLAPDHKLLRPWRFVIVRGAARDKLGEAFVQGLRATVPGSSPELETKARGKTTRSPLMLVLIASPKPEAKLPLWEQHASVSAAAQNICLTAHALGLGSSWKSASFCDAAPVREVLGMKAHENCFGWIELGHLPADLKIRERPPVALADVVTELR